MRVLRQRVARRERLGSRALRIGLRVVAAAALAGGALAAGLAGWRGLCRGPLSVREVRVEGAPAREAERLRAAVSDFLGTPVLRADLDALRRRLESDPSVRRAFVRRELPARLVARVEMRRPEVVLALEGRALVADEDGIVLGPASAEAPGPPRLTGLDRTGPGDLRDRIRLGVALAREIRAAGGAGAEIHELDLSDPAAGIRARDGEAGPWLVLPPQGAREALLRYGLLRDRIRATAAGMPSVDLRFRDQIGVMTASQRTGLAGKGW